MKAEESPIEWKDVPHDEILRIKRKEGEFIRSQPGGVWMPKSFQSIADKIYNFEVRKDDIWIVTYPKCGTTWAQELVWHIVHNVDIEAAKKSPLMLRSPFLEMEAFADKQLVDMMQNGVEDEETRNIIKSSFHESIELVKNSPSPRIIKTHLPMSLLPQDLFTKGCKVIYVSRNPKDSFVSFFHHNTIFHTDFMEDFRHFQQMFLSGTLVCGSYWYHLKEAWKRRDHPNLKILWYEDLKKDFIQSIREMSKFLGYHMTELKILTLDDYLYIDNHRNHGSKSMSGGNPEMEQIMKKFFRKGEVGDWKNHLDEKDLEEWDSWIKANIKGTDIKLTFE